MGCFFWKWISKKPIIGLNGYFLIKLSKSNKHFRELVQSYVNSVKYSILLNGSFFGNITPGQDLRQGDPLSPYLFILCSEVLSWLCLRSEACNELHDIKVGRKTLAVSHLLYADDLMIFGWANDKEVKAF